MANGNNQALVYWEPPASDGGSPILQYRIQAFDFLLGKYLNFQYVSAPAMSYIYTGLINGHGYNFKVEAFNAVGPSPYVFTNTVTPPDTTGP
jgi:hypothetical protein